MSGVRRVRIRMHRFGRGGRARVEDDVLREVAIGHWDGGLLLGIGAGGLARAALQMLDDVPLPLGAVAAVRRGTAERFSSSSGSSCGSAVRTASARRTCARRANTVEYGYVAAPLHSSAPPVPVERRHILELLAADCDNSTTVGFGSLVCPAAFGCLAIELVLRNSTCTDVKCALSSCFEANENAHTKQWCASRASFFAAPGIGTTLAREQALTSDAAALVSLAAQLGDAEEQLLGVGATGREPLLQRRGQRGGGGGGRLELQ